MHRVAKSNVAEVRIYALQVDRIAMPNVHHNHTRTTIKCKALDAAKVELLRFMIDDIFSSGPPCSVLALGPS
jgi:hypothetical protein